MLGFEFKELKLKGAYLISGFYIGDDRGSFTKNFEKDIFAKAGIEFRLSESFFSCSAKNVIRGLHFQTHNPQAKLVSVVAGSVWDVIVDLRLDSPTFKQWVAYELSAKNHLSLYVPRGFAHGFLSLEDNTVMFYQCDGEYDKFSDTGIIYNDATLDICWPIKEKDVIHSKRDLEFGNFTHYLNNPMII